MAGALQGMLHRDVSVGNIVISDRGGVLIDRDLSKGIEYLEKISQQPFRTGAWQFPCGPAVASQGISSAHSG